jgi:predicted DNA-binding transcriptional regulator AlpA
MSATNPGAVHNGFQDGAPTQITTIDLSRLTRAECAALLGPLLARLLATDESPVRESNSDGDRLLTIAEVEQLLKVTRSWIYHHSKRLGFAVKLGDGTLRFSHARIQQYMLECTVKRRSQKR